MILPTDRASRPIPRPTAAAGGFALKVASVRQGRRAETMKPRVLLTILSQAGRRSESLGFSMASTLLVALALTLGSVAVASYFSGALLSSRTQSSRNDAMATAEAGINRVMSTLNQPVNRRLLVSGRSMQDWGTAADSELQSPCRDTANQPPGNPTTEARNFGDGKFRALDTLDVDKGSRQFRVTKVTYSAGLADQADRRSQSVTTTAGSGTLTKVGTFSSDLINLNDPVDVNKFPGYNKGHFTVTVEAKVVEGGKVSTATLTREYEVVPRCCGASFGSNASGGASLNNSSSLGSDSRFCGVEFGMIVGLNGGTAWQNLANDRYTKRLASGSVVPISNIIGIVSEDGDEFSRATQRTRPNSASTTIPDPCDPTGGPVDRAAAAVGAALLRQNPEAVMEPRPTSMAQRCQAFRSLLRPSRCPRSAVNR
jgi:hypothetical protein